ncbi:MAG: methyltransferase domain-containing protein [Bacteroidales bacterium]|nr:methyltransferase domain-containing protein [Bacteroidales bacterium]
MESGGYMVALKIISIIVLIFLFLKGTNFLSYTLIKKSVVKSRIWDLNICCGFTDGGGINADIQKYGEMPNFLLTKDIYKLPFSDNQFTHVLTSHTVEHIEDPRAFIDELHRVGENVTILVPPLWDLSAAFNFLEHKWLFLTFRTKVDRLPRYIRLPLANWYQKKYGQRIKA